MPAAGDRSSPPTPPDRVPSLPATAPPWGLRSSAPARPACAATQRPGRGDRTPGIRAAPPVRDASPATGGALAAPVIVLIVVVVLLTLGVAYMVITGDGTSKPVDEQPGASTPSVPVSMHQA